MKQTIEEQKQKIILKRKFNGLIYNLEFYTGYILHLITVPNLINFQFSTGIKSPSASQL